MGADKVYLNSPSAKLYLCLWNTIVQNIDDCGIKFEYALNKSEKYRTRAQHVWLNLGIPHLLFMHTFSVMTAYHQIQVYGYYLPT